MQTRNIVRKHRPDVLIILFMSILMLVGLIIIYAISPQQANVRNIIYGSDYSPSYFFIKQLVSVAAAIIAFTIAAKVPAEFTIKRVAKPILITSFLVCIILAIAGALKLGIANCSFGACRWVDFGFINFQPSELLKLGLLLCLAIIFGTAMKQGHINKLGTLTPAAVIIGVSLFFVVIAQKDLGTGIALISIVLSMLVASGMSWKHIGVMLSIAVILGVLFTVTSEHRRERILTYFNPNNENSYHINNAKIAIGSGGLFGVGIGRSIQSTGYLPESINDSVFAIIGETFGFIGLMVVIALFVSLLLTLLKNMHYTHDPVYRLIFAGVFGWLGAHVMMNIAAMTGIMPLTGITLPFLSYGGTSIVFMAATLGLAFQLSGYTAHTPANERKIDEDTNGRRGIRRTRYSSVGRHHRA